MTKRRANGLFPVLMMLGGIVFAFLGFIIYGEAVWWNNSIGAPSGPLLQQANPNATIGGVMMFIGGAVAIMGFVLLLLDNR